MSEMQNLESRLTTKLDNYKSIQATLIAEISDLKDKLNIENKEHDKDGLWAMDYLLRLITSIGITVVCIIVAISTEEKAFLVSILFVILGFSTAIWGVFSCKNWIAKFKTMMEYTAFCKENHPNYENKLIELEKTEAEIAHIKKTLCLDEE